MAWRVLQDMKRIMHVIEWRIVSALTRGLFWCLFPELRSNKGNKYQNNTRVNTETIRHESTYIILFLTWYNEFINNDNNDHLYIIPMSQLLRIHFADNCEAITWIVANSLDIDFIHGDIHGQSCKKSLYMHRTGTLTASISGWCYINVHILRWWITRVS